MDDSGPGRRTGSGDPAGPGEQIRDEGAAAGEAEAEIAVPVEQAATEERISVEGADFLALLSNRGAQLVSYRLKQHLRADGQGLDLVRRRVGELYPFGLVDGGGEPLPVNEGLFVLERRDTEAEFVLEFRHSSDLGEAVKTFRFPRDGGIFHFEGRVRSEDPWGLFLGPGLENPRPDELERPQFERGVVYRAGGEREELDSREEEEVTVLAGSLVSWVALQDTYFVAAAVPERGVAEVRIAPFLFRPSSPEGDSGSGEGRFEEFPVGEKLAGADKDLIRELAVTLRAEGSSLEVASYWGAKDFDVLAALPYGLEGTVHFGMLDFLARPLHSALRWIHDQLTGNYGWAIVVMTILIRLLMLPLTHTSMRSMQKMQELNPKVSAIRAKYKPKMRDKQGRPNFESQQKMNEEIMALYRSAGVNPAAGCFPMLLQLPVFFAFYMLLQGAIELRQAPWILWVKDLSVADPIYLLPILMFVTQFIQQLRMPMSGDPLQRKLFLAMPFIFFFIFLNFQAGLVLYWLTNNVVSIIQQEVYRKVRGGESASAAAR